MLPNWLADGELPRTFSKCADRPPVLYTRAAARRICSSGQGRGPAPGSWLRAKCDTDCNGLRIRLREGPNAISSQLGTPFSARRIRRKLSAALTKCKNKVTFSERSYAHCSMYRYVHPRTFDSILGMSYAHYPFSCGVAFNATW